MSILRNIKMFVFDMAGTTVNEKGLVYKTFLSTFKEFGIKIPPEDFVRFYGMEKSQVISDVVDMIPTVPEENKEKIYNKFKVNLREAYSDENNISPMRGSYKLFDMLREKNIKVCLNTGFDREMAEMVVEKMKFKNRIDDFVSSSEVSKGRPFPFMINELMKRHGIQDPRQIIKVGDTTLDILEGKNSGTLYQMAVLTGEESTESLLRNSPTHVFDNLENLTRFLEAEEKKINFTPWAYN